MRLAYSPWLRETTNSAAIRAAVEPRGRRNGTTWCAAPLRPLFFAEFGIQPQNDVSRPDPPVNDPKEAALAAAQEKRQEALARRMAAVQKKLDDNVIWTAPCSKRNRHGVFTRFNTAAAL
jgi:hypothetical protein